MGTGFAVARGFIVGALIATVALLAMALAVAGNAQASSGRTAIPHSRPSWLGHSHNLGAAPGSASLHARVYLAPNGGMDALKRAALAVSTPGNAQYRHFISPGQYFARFGTTDATVSRVRSWLTGAGLDVSGVAAHNRYIAVSGHVRAAERAFGVEINRYRHNKMTVHAPDAALTAPAGVARSVLAVSGVDTTPSIVHPAAKPPPPEPAGFRNAPPCSTYYGEKVASSLPTFQGQELPYAPCGYVGSQFRSAYEGPTALDGSGVTVAITDAYAAPTIASDASTYASRHGDAAYGNDQLTQNLPKRFRRAGLCDSLGWYGEETLDVESVHAMAQGAGIRYYGSASCTDDDFLDTFARVNDEARAQIVSNSWGDIEAAEKSSVTNAYEQAFAQGALEGISYVFSSGDNGDEVAASGSQQADYPASDPMVTAVGGTTAAIDQAGTLAWETGWGTERRALSSDGASWGDGTFLYGAGGGASTLFAQPSYQSGIAPPGARQVPDVGLDADPTTGMLVGETQTFPDGVYYDEYRIGGTSLASPLFAGMTALAFQNAGGGIGELNPTIYANASSGAFTDVVGDGPDPGNVRVDYANSVDDSSGTVTSLRTFNQDSSLTVGPGWDNVTGLGSPNAGWLTAISP